MAESRPLIAFGLILCLFAAIVSAMTLAVSDHFNGKTFFQPGSHPERGFRDVLRWRLTSKPAKWPKSVALAPQPAPPTPTGDQIVATWLGHASFLIQTTDGNVLFDPVFSERVSPVTWAGPRRVHRVPLSLEALPRIDAVCISHDHYDHCDLATLRTLARHRDTVFIAPLRHRDLLQSAGATEIIELDWWQETTLPGGLEIQLTPTKHWTKRLGTPRNHRLWGGFWLRVPPAAAGETPGRREPRQMWFVGDSGYDEPFFRALHARCGPPDLALVPIGAYEPRWFMAPMHMNPDEAIRLHRDVGAKLSLAMHWGTFQLTDEAREEPVRALDAARRKYGVSADAFRVLEPGESVAV